MALEWNVRIIRIVRLCRPAIRQSGHSPTQHVRSGIGIARKRRTLLPNPVIHWRIGTNAGTILKPYQRPQGKPFIPRHGATAILWAVRKEERMSTGHCMAKVSDGLPLQLGRAILDDPHSFISRDSYRFVMRHRMS